MTTYTEWPDGTYAFLSPDQWPLVTVRFADGGLVDFRAGSEWPRSARVRYCGLDVNGLRVDVDAGVLPATGSWAACGCRKRMSPARTAGATCP